MKGWEEDLNLTMSLPDDGWGSANKANSRHLDILWPSPVDLQE